ncbi:MAG TPA: DUF2332 domain-containing protein [Streptosporangiaceae bacterium]|nr:DUF2332 domain-containing protein [Streptosporangiaceae bacterium]
MTRTADVYQGFAASEARGYCPPYEELARGVAADDRLLRLIEELPEPSRQPNLLFAATRYLGGPVTDGYAAFADWALARWYEVRATMLERKTQTNEPGRCASLLPVLTALPQPLALIEVGASAGLCLYPDKYEYRYDDRTPIGPADSPVSLACQTSGPVPFPADPPVVVWRAGVDLNPLDVRDESELRWLESLIWPGHDNRLDRLRRAAEIAAAEPPLLVRGDLNEVVADLVSRAPAGATPVVFHSAVLAYLPEPARDRFTQTMRSIPARWISNEGRRVLPTVSARLAAANRRLPQDRAVFVTALDEEPLALAGPHGQSLDWLPS